MEQGRPPERPCLFPGAAVRVPQVVPRARDRRYAGPCSARTRNDAPPGVARIDLVLVELLVVAVVAIGFGVWQLYDVTRAQRRDRERDDREPGRGDDTDGR